MVDFYQCLLQFSEPTKETGLNLKSHISEQDVNVKSKTKFLFSDTARKCIGFLLSNDIFVMFHTL